MFLGGVIAHRVLNAFPAPKGWTSRLTESSEPHPGKLEAYWGVEVWGELAGRTVIDFGCGTGADTVEIARRGAKRVIGIDIVPKALAVGRRAAERAGVADRCVFSTAATEKADRIVCIDGFEHFANPAQVLAGMADSLEEGGRALVSFGPPWFHPYGGHSFSVFPWAHLLFRESALLRWRSRYCEDGATRFHEVRGGLNQMTLSRFERLVEQSPLRIVDFEAIPIRAARLLHTRLTREFFTSMVRCKLERKPRAA